MKHITDTGTISYLDAEGNNFKSDAPALVWTTGGRVWKSDASRPGRKKRADGATETDADGAMYWLVEGHRHREDGPAHVHPTLGPEWWIDGDRVER